MSIQRLPGDVVVKIKSSITITSLNGTVCGLLRNSLDAGATNVSISVDYSRGGCVVEDDGVGIPPSEFLAEGGLGKLHHTSKYPRSARLHGRYGTFLASVASLSLLSVVSRHRSHASSHALTIHNGKVLRRYVPALPGQHALSPTHGTRVAVHDLFGCMPVRARLRPASDLSAWGRDWDELVRLITALLLAWPPDMTVTIRAENGAGHGRLPTATLHAAAWPAAQDADISRSTRLLLQAGLCDTAGAASWVRVGLSVPGVAIGGCICLTASASRRAQFIRIGIEPLAERHHADFLYDEINKLFSDSQFGMGAAGRSQTAARKAVDRWPMFCIGIDLDDLAAAEADDILDDRRQYLATIQALVRTMTVQFLKAHDLYGQTSMLRGQLESVRSDNESSDGSHSMTKPPSTKKRKTSTMQQHSSGCSIRARSLPSRNAKQPHSPFLAWSRVKSTRTVTETKRKPTAEIQCPDRGHFNGSPIQAKGPEQKGLQPAAYSPPTTRSKFFGGCDAAACTDEVEDRCSAQCGEKWHGSSFLSGNVRISREALAAAKVIGQVDQKFILVKSPASDDRNSGSMGDVLILIDQHAADERCRIEALLMEYFIRRPDNADVLEARTLSFEKPLQFELDAREWPLLERLQEHFRFWGVVYTVAAADTKNAVVLRVHELPESIFERCRHDSRLVVELIRKEVWTRHESGRSIGSSQAERDEASEIGRSWVARFHSCPQSILDLLNAKACHSAIRFNDPLSHAQCSDLLQRLLQCLFPFQCAHGRPSLVPLLDLGSNDLFGCDD